MQHTTTDTARLGILVHPTLAQAEPAWRRLQDTGTSYGFQTFEWLSAWQEIMGEPEGVQPCVVEVRHADSGAPVMLLPLGVYPQGGLRVLSFLGGWLTDYHAPLLDPAFAAGLSTEAFLALWERILPALPGADHIHFWRMPDNVEGAPNPVVRLPGARVNEHTHYSRLEGNYQDYVKGRESAYLRKAQRKRRKLAEAGAVEFSVVSDPAELGPTMDVLVRQKSRRHTRDGGRDPYAANPRLRAFYERLTLTGRDDPRGFLGRLTVNGEIVGTEWGFVHRGRFLDILPSYEASEWAKFSPGMVIKEDVFRWCFEQGLSIFDLTVGDEPYKSRIAEVEEPVYALHRPLTLKGRLFCARLHLRQAVRKVLGPPRQWLRSLFRSRGQAQ